MTRDEIMAILANRRQKLGWTQAKVARMIHVAPPAISMLESGKRKPTLEMAIRYAEAVGLKLVLVQPRGQR